MSDSSSSSDWTSMLAGGGKKIPVFCGYCYRNITLSCRFRCADAECSSGGSGEAAAGCSTCSTDLCPDCFAAAVVLLPHKPWHAHRVADCLDVPLFSRDWMASEELLLLEGIERFGCGNWKYIAEYVGSKNAKQCEDHYWDGYLGTFGEFLPSKVLSSSSSGPSSGAVPSDEVEQDTAGLLAVNNSLGAPSRRDELLAPFPDLQPGQPVSQVSVRGAGRDAGANAGRGGGGGAGRKEQELRERIAQLPGAELPGFMPLRGDFEIEHDNSAELLLADMEFAAHDHPSEALLKLDVIRVFNKKLDDRDERKQFVISRGIVDIKKAQLVDRRRSREDRELVARCRPFARFQTAEAHETLVSGLLLSRRLRKQIELLAHYRRQGMRTLEEARGFEIARRKKEQELKIKRSKQGADVLLVGASAGHGGEAGSRSSGVGPRSRGRGSLSEETTGGASHASWNESKDFDRDESGSHSLKASAIKNAPDGDLLSVAELDLCSSLGLAPQQYLAIQAVIVREAFSNGTLSADSISGLVKLDDASRDHLFHFFVRNMRGAFPSMPPEAGAETGAANNAGLSGRKRGRPADDV